MEENTKRICLVGELAYDERLLEAAKKFNVPVLSSATGLEFSTDNKWTTFFILKEFEGEIYEKLAKTKHK
jgi:protein ECT2